MSAVPTLFPGIVGEPYPYWLMPGPEGKRVQIEDRVRKNVCFIGVFENGSFRPKATGFLVSVECEFGAFVNLVTAEHVISGLATKGHKEIFLRFNTRDGGVEFFKTDASQWWFHPESEVTPTDVAVTPITIGAGKVEWLSIDTSLFVTPQNFEAEHELGVGDEVVVIGLFRSHFGKGRNIPIVRIGSLAAKPEEPVKTAYCGEIEGYLVELHSIGGLSGSPVYIHMPPVRVKNNEFHARHGIRTFLLGLMHGHFDVENMAEDVVAEDSGQGESINSGIGVVVPAHKILETLNQPELVKQREAVIKEMRKRAAKPDLDDAPKRELPTTADNPSHEEDFKRLVSEAAKKRPQDH